MTVDAFESDTSPSVEEAQAAKRWAISLIGISVLALTIAAWRLQLPSPDGPLALPASTLNWAGTGPETWSVDQIAATAAERGLAWAWEQPGVTQAVVSFPVSLRLDGGQTHLARGHWTEARPPVTATWLRRTTGTEIWLRLDRALVFNPLRVAVRWRGAAGIHDVLLLARPTPEGDCLARWVPSADTSSESLSLLVKPEGWHEGFPVILRPMVGQGGGVAATTSHRSQSEPPPVLAPWRTVTQVRTLALPAGTTPLTVLSAFREPLRDREVIGPGISYGLRSVIVAQRVRPGETALWWPHFGQPVEQSWIVANNGSREVVEGDRSYHAGTHPLTSL